MVICRAVQVAPLVVPPLGRKRRTQIHSVTPRIFGAGLGMALDEWVYLIATDGSNASYLLPVSFWGGVVVIGLALAYTATLMFFSKRADRKPR